MPCSSCLSVGHNRRTCPNFQPLRRKTIRIVIAVAEPPPAPAPATDPVWVCRHCKRESSKLFYAVQHERRCRSSC
jgi:hypothetical protein